MTVKQQVLNELAAWLDDNDTKQAAIKLQAILEQYNLSLSDINTTDEQSKNKQHTV